MEDTLLDQDIDEVSDPKPVSASKDFRFAITLYEYQGNCHISFSQNFPGRMRLAIALYAGKQPGNPRESKFRKAVTHHSAGNYDTGFTWGTGYSASLLAANNDNSNWMYIGVDTPVTKTAQ